MKSPILSIVLAVLIVTLGYFDFKSIKGPLKLRAELQFRNKAVISKLTDIRTAEILFKQLNNRYTGSFDTLSEFIRKGRIPAVKMVSSPRDTILSKCNNYSVFFISIADSIYGKKNNRKLSDIAIVPFSGGAKFSLSAGRIDQDSVFGSVFEVSAPYRVYLKGVDEDFLFSLLKEAKNKNKFPGLSVGSMSVVSTAGNWE